MNNKRSLRQQKKLFQHLITFAAFMLLIVLSGTPALANTTNNPYLLVEQVANKTFARIQKDQTLLASNPDHMKTIVTEELMPHVDHRYAGYYLLNKAKVSKAKRKVFYQAFKQYLVTTYATVFLAYDNQQVNFGQSKDFAAKTRVVVNTELVNPAKDNTLIDFKMRQNKRTKQWKAYDIRAQGISLLDSKRSEFAPILRQADGIDKVITLLNEKAQLSIKS